MPKSTTVRNDYFLSSVPSKALILTPWGCNEPHDGGLYFLSTTESEYVAASMAVRELIWIKRFIGNILEMENELLVLELNVDNQSAIQLIKNPEFHKRSKHIGKISLHSG